MYASIYTFRVPRNHIEAFLRVSNDVAAIYRELCAIDVEILRGTDLQAKYGCAAYNDVLELAEDEAIFVEIDRFRDRRHHDDVMSVVDADERIGRLYDEMANIIDIGRVVRGEFAVAS